MRLHPRGKDILSGLRSKTRLRIPSNSNRILQRTYHSSLQMLPIISKRTPTEQRPYTTRRHSNVHMERSRYRGCPIRPIWPSCPKSRIRPVDKGPHTAHERAQSDVARKRVAGNLVQRPGSVPRNRIEGAFCARCLNVRKFRTGLRLQCEGRRAGRGSVGRGR
jgi:hypothetical protein